MSQLELHMDRQKESIPITLGGKSWKRCRGSTVIIKSNLGGAMSMGVKSTVLVG